VGAYSPPGEGAIVDGYALAISDDGPGGRTDSTATNVATGAVIYGYQLIAPSALVAVQNGADNYLTFEHNEGGGTWTVIWRRPVNGTWAVLDHTAEGAVDYTDEDVTVGAYEYRVQCAPTDDGPSRSAYSDTASVTMLAAPTLAITPTSGAGPLPITCTFTGVTGQDDWTFRLANDAGMTVNVMTQVVAESPFETSQAAARTRYYDVRANAADGGYSAWSNVVQVITS
jgi:hypothetical protein